jgi:hypothetical protein
MGKEVVVAYFIYLSSYLIRYSHPRLEFSLRIFAALYTLYGQLQGEMS